MINKEEFSKQLYSMVKLEQFIRECRDVNGENNTLNYELFGQKVFGYFRSLGFRAFQLKNDK